MVNSIKLDINSQKDVNHKLFHETLKVWGG